MKTAFITAVAVAATAAIGLHAQSPTSSSASSSATKPMTVTGCVQRDSSGGASAFKLTDVTNGASAGTASKSSASSPTGSYSAASPSANATLDEYALQADSSVNLAQHVNQKVEITGTVASDATRSPSSSPSASDSMTPAASSTNGPALKVTSVRMLASSCQ